MSAKNENQTSKTESTHRRTCRKSPRLYPSAEGTKYTLYSVLALHQRRPLESLYIVKLIFQPRLWYTLSQADHVRALLPLHRVERGLTNPKKRARRKFIWGTPTANLARSLSPFGEVCYLQGKGKRGGGTVAVQRKSSVKGLPPPGSVPGEGGSVPGVTTAASAGIRVKGSRTTFLSSSTTSVILDIKENKKPGCITVKNISCIFPSGKADNQYFIKVIHHRS